jgi:pimeloyl-ACP methyl ester carboxylesterase
MMKAWEKEGVYHVVNGRTGQQMPIYYQMYRDYRAKQEAFDLKGALQRMEQPVLLVHGTEDPAVPHQAAEQMQGWQPKAEVQLIDGADHVFGGRHPFEGSTLPPHSQALCDHTLRFLDRQLI